LDLERLFCFYSKFEVIIDNFELNSEVELESTFSSSKKDILQLKKAKNSNFLEISTLAPNVKKQLPHFVLEAGINRALGDIFFKEYFKIPFIITSERTGISLFYKELDINKNVMVEHLTNNKSKDIDPFKLFEDSISRYAMPIRHNIDYTRDLGDGICKKKSFLYGDKEILVKENIKPFIKSLGHIFRNSVDHGIEIPEIRIEKNKSEKGIIKCQFKQINNKLHISISDNGSGLNISRIREIAISQDIDISSLKEDSSWRLP